MHSFILILSLAYIVGLVAVFLKHRKNVLFGRFLVFSLIGAVIGVFFGSIIGIIIANEFLFHGVRTETEILFIIETFMSFGCFLGVIIFTSRTKEDWIKI